MKARRPQRANVYPAPFLPHNNPREQQQKLYESLQLQPDPRIPPRASLYGKREGDKDDNKSHHTTSPEEQTTTAQPCPIFFERGPFSLARGASGDLFTRRHTSRTSLTLSSAAPHNTRSRKLRPPFSFSCQMHTTFVVPPATTVAAPPAQGGCSCSVPANVSVPVRGVSGLGKDCMKSWAN